MARGEVERHRQSVTESESPEKHGDGGRGGGLPGGGGSEQARGRSRGATMKPGGGSLPEQRGGPGRHPRSAGDPRSASGGQGCVGGADGGLPDT